MAVWTLCPNSKRQTIPHLNFLRPFHMHSQICLFWWEMSSEMQTCWDAQSSAFSCLSKNHIHPEMSELLPTLCVPSTTLHKLPMYADGQTTYLKMMAYVSRGYDTDTFAHLATKSAIIPHAWSHMSTGSTHPESYTTSSPVLLTPTPSDFWDTGIIKRKDCGELWNFLMFWQLRSYGGMISTSQKSVQTDA